MKLLLPQVDHSKLQLHRKPWKGNQHVFCRSQFLPPSVSHHLCHDLFYLNAALPMQLCMPLWTKQNYNKGLYKISILRSIVNLVIYLRSLSWHDFTVDSCSQIVYFAFEIAVRIACIVRSSGLNVRPRWRA